MEFAVLGLGRGDVFSAPVNRDETTPARMVGFFTLCLTIIDYKQMALSLPMIYFAKQFSPSGKKMEF